MGTDAEGNDDRRIRCRRETDTQEGQCFLAEMAAHEAAKIAVREVFSILGVDVDVPRDVAAFRDDLRFGSRLRRAADRGAIAFVVVAAGGFATAMILGIKALLRE